MYLVENVSALKYVWMMCLVVFLSVVGLSDHRVNAEELGLSVMKTVSIDLTEHKNKPLQIVFKNGVIRDTYYYNESTNVKTAYSLATLKYTNIYESENFSGLIHDSKNILYFDILTNGEDPVYEINNGHEDNPFDYTGIDLEEGNYINTWLSPFGSNFSSLNVEVTLEAGHAYLFNGNVSDFSIVGPGGYELYVNRDISYIPSLKRNNIGVATVLKPMITGTYLISAGPDRPNEYYIGLPALSFELSDMGVTRTEFNNYVPFKSLEKAFTLPTVDGASNYASFKSIVSKKFGNLASDDYSMGVKNYFNDDRGRDYYRDSYDNSQGTDRLNSTYYNLDMLVYSSYKSLGTRVTFKPVVFNSGFDWKSDLSIENQVSFGSNLKVDEPEEREVFKSIKAYARDMSEIGDPVDAFRGNFVDRKTLLSYSGDRALSFDMSYDSIANDSVSLASGFVHNFETRLARNSVDEISIYWNPNAVTRFDRVDGVWKSKNGKDVMTIEETSVGYKVTDDRVVYEFDLDGKLLKTIDDIGLETVFEYTNGLLSKVTNHRGQSFDFTYSNGKLVTVTDLMGRSLRFNYDTAYTKLNSVTYPNGKLLTFSYVYGTANDHSVEKLSSMSFDDTIIVQNVYNEMGAVDYQYDGERNRTEFIYDEWSNAGEITTIMTQADGSTIEKTHNSLGQVIREKNERGFVRTFTYDEKGNKLTETDYKGNVTTFEYDARGNVITKRFADESVIRYEYDGRNLMDKVIDRDGLFSTYEYDELGRMTKMTDKMGVSTTFEYDVLGNVSRQVTGARVLERTYDEKGNLVRLKLPDGTESTMEYDVLGRQTATEFTDGRRSETMYDVQNNVTKVVGFDDGITLYEYDSFGKKIKETDELGRVKTFVYDKNGNLKTETQGTRGKTYTYDNRLRLATSSYKSFSGAYRYEYDAVGNVVKEIDEEGKTIVREYDANNNVIAEIVGNDRTEFSYDVMDRMVSKKDPLGNVTTYEYDVSGLLIASVSALGNRTEFTYDEMGRQLTITDPKGNVTSKEYNVYGEVVKTTDALGNVTMYKYDDRGKLVETVNALGESTYSTYNEYGQLIETRNNRNEITSTFTYDVSGNIVEMVDGNGNSTRMVYDGLGNLIESYNGEGNLISKDTYNEFNEVISRTNALNQMSSYLYNTRGLVSKETDARGNATSYSYFYNGNLSSVTDANYTSTSNVYDVKNRMTRNSIGSFSNNFVYNGNDQIISDQITSGNLITYQYDGDGNMSQRKNARGDVSKYEYDLNGNVIKEVTKEGTVTHEYDALNRKIKTISGSDVIERTYDALGRVIEKIQNGKSIKYVYDDRGHMAEMVYPDGKRVLYTYDVVGNLLTVTDWKNNVTAYEYNKNNQLTKTTHSNGVIETRNYNVEGQLTELKSVKGENVITHYTYEYDAEGNITKETDVKNNKVNNFTFDKLGRLTNANGNTYAYSSTGNVTSYSVTVNGQLSSKTLSYNSDNSLSRVGSDLTSVDKDGNLLTYKLNGKTYVATYDSQNKLIQYGNQHYRYDAEGNRVGVRDTNGLGVTTSDVSFVVDNDSNRLSRILVESSTAGDVYYVYGHGLISEHRGSDVNTYHFDYRGSTVAMTDASGSVKGTASYDEYGVKLSNTLATRFTYNGQFGVEDDGTGLYYMRTRYYNVDLKRFMNRDVVVGSVSSAQSLNRYAYVNGNPISYTDPFGMARETLEQTQSLAGFDIHLLLDVAGMVPVIGEFADATNTVLYLGKGQYGNAALSGAAMVPFAGNFVTGGKLGVKVSGKLPGAKEAFLKLLQDQSGHIRVDRLFGTKTAEFAEKKLQKHRDKIAKHGVAPKHKNELHVGRYKDLSNTDGPYADKYDDVEAHHLVSDLYLQKYGIHRDSGIAINMHKDRHSGTPTYKAGHKLIPEYFELDPREALAFDLKQVRKIYRDAGFDRKEVNDAVREVIKQWEAHESGLMKKR